MHRFRDARCLITGGLGFIGSTLARSLVEQGAHVTLVDAMIPEYGGNLFNVADIRDQVQVNFGDIRDVHAMAWLVRGQDFVFHLAGQVSHVMSMKDPYPDIEYNVKGTVVLMESIREYAPKARVVFTGTRGQYGPATKLPVSEDAPTNPRGIYEITNLAAEKIVQVYHHTHDIWSVALRLTNIYGPRAQMRHSQYGVANWFVRLALDGETLKIFGDGKIKRDFLYVDDCVEAILTCAACDAAGGEVLNVGIDEPNTFLELAEKLIKIVGRGRWEYAPFSRERKAQEPGDFYSDITKIRQMTGWTPRTSLEEGLRRTVEFYRQHGRHYWINPRNEAKAA